MGVKGTSVAGVGGGRVPQVEEGEEEEEGGLELHVGRPSQSCRQVEPGCVVMTCGVTLEKAGVYSVIGFQAVTNHAHMYVKTSVRTIQKGEAPVVLLRSMHTVLILELSLHTKKIDGFNSCAVLGRFSALHKILSLTFPEIG